jgi:hypothetical protein
MKKQAITRIYVAGYRYDAEFTRCCVASIREWHPDIPLFLIKDRFYGDYYTRDIERHWNVEVYEVGNRVFGWGFSKLEPLFEDKRERFLVLDSDILVLGNLIKDLEQYDSDFVIRGQKSDGIYQATQYFDPKALTTLDNNYQHRGIGFNTGQWVGSSGIFRRHEFERFVNFSNPPKLRHPEIFQLGEQGLLNYFLFKNQDLGRITIDSVPFMEIGTNPAADRVHVMGQHLSFERPIILHWAGCRGKTPETSPNGRLFSFFATRFASKVPFGRWRRYSRDLKNVFLTKLKSAVLKITRSRIY